MEKTIKYLENGEYHYATVKDVGDLAKLKTDSKDDLVAAINDLFENGGENAGKPEGYDNLVNNVADAIQKQQQMSSTITNMQQTAQLSDAEMAHMKQVQEELRQEYLKAIKELNEAVEKAKADAAALDKKTNDMQDKIDETFADVNKEVSDVHKQLDAEATGLHKDLDDTKTSLEATRKDLLNSTQKYGQVHSDVQELQDKFSRRVWSTDLDPVREQVSKNSTEVQQTKDELKNKADQSNLDLVTNSVENLSAQVKQNASGLEVAVKRDELGGDVARLLGDKTNLLLGTRSFSGEDNWKNRDTVTIEPGYYKGLKSAAVQVLDGSIYQPYRVKANTAYTFSFFGKEDRDNPKATLVIKPIDAQNVNVDGGEQQVHITTEWQRFAVTFSVDQECEISIQIIQGPEATNNILHLAGLKLQYGQNNTPWEPNEADVAENIEHTESQFNVYSDQITGIVKKQEKMGDTERQLDTRITETAEGLKQTSKDLQNANGKITEFKGQLESTAKGLKTEYEKYTNEAIGQISDSSLNLIHNSAFSNQDNQFESWQNISAKATVREDSNNLHWVELTQTGQGTDNPIGVTSNYFIVKQGKVTVAVDVKLGDKANLDNQNILLLELYDENKKRVDFTDVSVSQLGLSMSVLNDHNVHRGLYRLGIDRKDVKYMTVKAILHRNGDLWLTNFSARLSSIDDGGYTPNPDDVNHQILKMNTKIEEDAEHIALKANSVDVTRDIKSAVDGIQVGGTNLLKGTSSEAISGDAPTTGWKDMGSIYNTSGPLNEKQYVLSFDARGDVDKQIIQTFLWAGSLGGHNIVTSSVTSQGDKYYSEDGNSNFTLTTQWTRYWVIYNVSPDNTRKQVIVGRRQAQASGKTASGKVYIKSVKLEEGNKSTSWSPAPEDTSAEIKSAKDAAIQVASDQINLHVNELSTSFDDKLNKRVNEVKTASEKFTSDGIEQTVKKITEVKNNVDGLGNRLNDTQSAVNGVSQKIDNLQVGGRNYLRNSDKTITGWSQDLGTIPNETLNELAGKTITVSCDVEWSGYAHDNSQQNRLGFEASVTGSDGHNYWIGSWKFPNTSSGKERISTQYTLPSGVTFTVNNNGHNGYIGINGSGKVSHVKIEIGNRMTDWTPAPEDINEKIDTQILDSANIDNMRTQGHYFVHNLTGNPIPGWVYVDVTGNNNDRIRQDVYQDNGTKHMYRRLFGSSWSDWEQGAYISDVNNVKTEVTASVKNLGDRVTTEVNSVETRVNNKIDGIQVGGRNILSNTENLVYKAKVTNSTNNPNSGDSMWKLAVGNLSDWLRNNPDVKEIAISYDYELQGATPTGTIRFGVNQAPTWEYMSGFNLQGKPAKGRVKLIVPVTDNMRETASNISRIRGDGLPIGATLIISHPKWEIGNKATDWSPAPEDTAEAIKEVNTKWDVANGQIQGKVTETDVNNILNGKGYATQSWAESNFRMKSDSIELEVKKITDPISDKINNLQVGGRNLLANSSNDISVTSHTTDGYPAWANIDTGFSFEHGKTYTFSAEAKNSTNKIAEASIRVFEGSTNTQVGIYAFPADGERHSVTFTIPNDSHDYHLLLYAGHAGIVPGVNVTTTFHHPKLELGNVATDWTPAPEDINKKIDTQVLDSANIDNMRTQGHYFVKNLTGNPIPGWVYVDVTGNNNDRIRQDVYGDQSYVHKFRSWNGSRWTDWEEEVKNTDIITKINMSPEEIKLSSKKIEIDGNTYIHGDLQTKNVRLVGKKGVMDLSGDSGLVLQNNNGSIISLGESGLDLKYKNDFEINIDSQVMTLSRRNGVLGQEMPIAFGNIGSVMLNKDTKSNGFMLRYNPGSLTDPKLAGASFMAFGYNTTTPGEIQSQMIMYAKDTQITGTRAQRKGIHFLDAIEFDGNLPIRFPSARDNLYIHSRKWDSSQQAGYYQPSISLQSNDGNYGSAGVTFQWDAIKPFGAVDMTNASIWMQDAEKELRFNWIANDSVFGGAKLPALYRPNDDGSIASGIAFAPGSTWDFSSGVHNITAGMLRLGV